VADRPCADVGKALGLSLDLVDQMARKLDGWQRGTLSAPELAEIGLNPDDPTVAQVIELTAQLLGFPRHLGQHVGGMVMTRGPLCEIVPIENAVRDDRTVIEWDKDDIDTLGILKVDLLGLGMLSCIAKALMLVNETAASEVGAGSCAPLELHTIPAEDPAVYDMVCEADTVGVFQIESRAQMSNAAAPSSADVLRPCDRSGDRSPRGPFRGTWSTPICAAAPGWNRRYIRAKRCGRCWAKPWACRCSRNRRCGW